MNFQLYKILIFAYFWLFSSAGHELAYAFNTQNDWTPAKFALAFDKSSRIWTRLDLGLFDGEIVTDPPGTISQDRRIETLAIIGTEIPMSPKFSLRINFQGEFSKRRRLEKDDSSLITDQYLSKIIPSLDATYIMDGGLEIFGGITAAYYPKQEIKHRSSDGENTVTFKPVFNAAPRLGVTRRNGSWSGGLYYSFGNKAKRNFTRKDTSGSIFEDTDEVYEAPVISVFGEMKASAIYDFEMSAIQEGGGGTKSENGNNVRSDYLRFAVGSTIPFPDLSLRFGLAHQTLSYSESASMTLDSIPMWSARGLAIVGSPTSHFFTGLIAGYGRDRQSLPQINAIYRVQAVTLTSGVNVQW